MAGHSVLPCLWTGKDGTQYLVRYHWRPMAGEKTITANEAEFLAGFDPDVATRDLYHTLEEGIPVEYEMEIQIASRELALQPDLDLMNPTLLWPYERFPPVKVGKMILDNGPENYEEEVESIAFSPGNTVNGIGLTDHDLCRIGALACDDAHRHRLGSNYRKMKINTPKESRLRERQERLPTIGDGVEMLKCNDKIRKEPSVRVDSLVQAGERLQNMEKEERKRLAMTIAEEILFIDEPLQAKIVAHLRSAREDFGNVVAERIGI